MDNSSTGSRRSKASRSPEQSQEQAAKIKSVIARAMDCLTRALDGLECDDYPRWYYVDDQLSKASELAFKASIAAMRAGYNSPDAASTADVAFQAALACKRNMIEKVDGRVVKGGEL